MLREHPLLVFFPLVDFHDSLDGSGGIVSDAYTRNDCDAIGFTAAACRATVGIVGKKNRRRVTGWTTKPPSRLCVLSAALLAIFRRLGLLGGVGPISNIGDCWQRQ
jgi:hypothetical protein